MKKRVVAVFLGVMLSLSMGLEAGAAALEAGFEDGFAAEQEIVPDESETPESTDSSSENEEDQEADADPAGQQETEAPTEEDSAEDFAAGFISDADTDIVQSDDFAAEPEVTVPVEVPEEQANTTGTVFEWNEWEKAENGKYRLRKKSTVTTLSAESTAEVGTAESQETADDTEVTDTDATDEIQQADAAPQYYTLADGIVEITTHTAKGINHTGKYLFDAEGYLVTGIGTTSSGEFYFTAAEEAQAYNEYKGETIALEPWTSTYGQLKKDSWFWNEKDGTFRYFGNDGKKVTVPQLAALAQSQNTYTGYYKINDHYYCLDDNGKPRTGSVTLTVKGVSSEYYFEPTEDENGIPGRMFRDGWKVFATAKGEQWKYYDSGELNSAKIGQLLVHGVITTDLDGRKDSQKTYLIDKNGYLLKNKMQVASDKKYYFTDKNGAIYKNRIVTYKKKQYYVTESGAKATWKKCWHRCPGAGNRMYYFGSKPGRIVKKTGWQKVTKSNGRFYGWFLFNKYGNHYSNKKRGRYYFKADGRLASGITVINGKSYFYTPSSSKNRNGKLVKKKMFTYKGKTYYAGSDGALRKTGWQYIDGEWYYFKNMNIVKNAFVKKNGKYGYVDNTGRFTTGWVIVNDAQNLVRYINPDAKGFVKNTSKRINGKLYYFDKKGYRINDLTSKYKGPYTVEVDRINGVMTVYADSARTIPVKTIRVSVGNPGTDTPTGSYTLTSYSRWQPLMGPSWGQYGTHVDGAGQGGIFVHSIACGAANSYNLPVSAYYRLGSPASHGCIRTCVADAKWVYEHCNGSRIYIFDGTYKSNECFKGSLGRRAITPLKGTKNGGYYDPTDPAA